MMGCVWTNATDVSDGSCRIEASQEFSGKAWIGVLLSLVGDIIINIGMNAMKHAHNINTDPVTEKPIKHFTLISWWWIGILGIVGGEVGNLIAYGYAPASIVTPIGSIGVVTNVVITTFVLKEPFTARVFAGVICVVIGIVVVVLYAPLTVVFVSSNNLWTDVIFTTNFGIYLAWMAVMLVILYPLSRKYGEKSVVIYVALCAVIASLTIVCAKTFSTLVANGMTNGMETEFLTPWPYVVLVVMIISCVVSMGYVNKAMMVFGNSQVVPCYFALFTTAGVGSSAWVYREFQCLENPVKGALFFVGIGIAIIGVFLVSSGTATRVAPADDEEQGAADKNGPTPADADDEVGRGGVQGVASFGPIDESGRNPLKTHGEGPTPDAYIPATPQGPEGVSTAWNIKGAGASSDSLSQTHSHLHTLSPILAPVKKNAIGEQNVIAPYSPEDALHTTQAVDPLARALSPTSRRMRGKQSKQGRCGLSQLKPLPPLGSRPEPL